MDIIFLSPYMKEVVWGGTKINEIFSYETDSKNIGEAWIVSANKNGYSTVKNGELKGLTLKELWDNHRELFGNMQKPEFPVLLKYIDARDDLSIQVHPNNEYAIKHDKENNGKAECWYVIDCEKDADIIIGHNAKNKEELTEMIEQKKWKELLKIRKVKKGDFFDIPTGTVHAIRKGTLIFETQQNSDLTYRLYDYDRLQNGKLRPLHIQKSIDVITCPDIETKKEITNEKKQILVDNEYFKVEKINLNGKETIKNNQYFSIICVLEGQGIVNGYEIKKGDNFIIPSHIKIIDISGNLEMMKIN